MSSFTEDEREEKLRHLMDVYGDGLKRLCCVYLRDLGLAEDAVQETFIKAYDHIDELLAGEIESAKAWLMRIAVNTCKDYRRTQWLKNRNRVRSIDELPESICPVAGVSRELFLTVLALPDKYKQVVLLHHYQQMTMEETADALRISRPAVSRRLKKAYELLRAEMEGGEERELG